MKPNEVVRRSQWLLWMFRQARKRNSNVKEFQFWQQNNQPIEIWSLNVFEQKLNYVHENPVKRGFVSESWHYKYSSAKNYCDDDQTTLEIDVNL